MSFDLVPDVTADGVVQPAQWSAQTLWWSERYRSKGLVWPADTDWFSNDPLGPKPHTHPDASEVFFVVRGRMQLTVGAEKLELGPGDYVLVPPDTYHEPLNIGGEDLCVLVVVAPNWRDRRWNPEGFVDSDYTGRGTVVPTGEPGPLPSDDLIASEVLLVEPGQSLGVDSRKDADRLLYVLDGTASITLEHLTGDVETHQYVNVMAGARHEVRGAGDRPVRLLSVWTPYVASH